MVRSFSIPYFSLSLVVEKIPRIVDDGYISVTPTESGHLFEFQIYLRTEIKLSH